MQINLGPVGASSIMERSLWKYKHFSRSFALIALLVSTMIISSCGFHLRSYGESNAAIQAISLDCPSTSSWELCHHIKQTLILNDIQVIDDAPLILSISQMVQKSRTLSLQPNASAAELGLSSEVTYKIISANEDEIKHKQSVHVNNSYRHESSALLAKDRERDELQMQLSQQLAEMIVRQVTILTLDETPDVQPATQNVGE